MGDHSVGAPTDHPSRLVSKSTCRLILFLAVVSGLLIAPGSAAATPDEVSCEACIVVDGGDRKLWGRAIHVAFPNASTTKMVTALIVVRDSDLNEEVLVSPFAAATGGGRLDLVTGDSYTIEDLLYALLLTSSNDASVALAEHTHGSEVAFVAEMNAWADRAGLRDTSFVTPHGLDAPGHESTASDLAKIGARLLKEPVLADIVATTDTTIPGAYLENRNLLLESYRGAIGIKTGTTLGAGEVLVAAARRNDRLVIAVAMRSLNAAADATALLDYGFKRLRQEIVLAEGRPMGEVVLDPAGALTVELGRQVKFLGPEKKGGSSRRSAGATVEYELDVDDELPATIERGDRVGTMRVVLGNRTLETAPLVAAESVDPLSSSFWLRLVESILGLVAALFRTVGLA